MRLIVFANKIDSSDDLMGFLSSWVDSLSHSLDSIIIVAQHTGVFSFPSNVRVLSIDKYKHPGILSRLCLYWKILFQERVNYDAVLVVMAPSWTIASWPALVILGKKLYLWYAVWRSSFALRIASLLVDKIFTSVKTSFPFLSSKVYAVGQSIDTEVFIPSPDKVREGRILFLGRISPVKKIEVLLSALAKSKEVFKELVIAGDIVRYSDGAYKEYLKKIITRDELGDRVKWLGKIPHSQAALVFQSADIFVNLTPAGSFDKAMLEAMACGVITISSNPALREFLSPFLWELLIFREGDSIDLEDKIKKIFSLPRVEREVIRSQLREMVLKNHSLTTWKHRLLENL